MGWLFGRKKKVPKVPFPQGKPFDEGALSLPQKEPDEKVIEPEDIKAAAGLEEPLVLPEEPMSEMPPPPEEIMSEEPAEVPAAPIAAPESGVPIYIKMDVYQRILGEIENSKLKIGELKDASRHLETSEFNEEDNFAKLKRLMRSMHDHLLLADKIIYKTQGE